jgi:hypothetical protein
LAADQRQSIGPRNGVREINKHREPAAARTVADRFADRTVGAHGAYVVAAQISERDEASAAGAPRRVRMPADRG